MFDNSFFPLVLGIRNLNSQQFTNRTLLKKDLKARYPTIISTTIIKVNTKNSGKSANRRHMILFRTYLTNISISKCFFFLIEEMIVYNVKRKQFEEWSFFKSFNKQLYTWLCLRKYIDWTDWKIVVEKKNGQNIFLGW